MSIGAKFGYHSNKERVACGAAVYLMDQELASVAMIYRIGAHGAESWAVPGGWQHPGEDPEKTAVRETWEEVGVVINSLDFLGYTHTVFEEGVESTCLWFTTVDWSGTIRNTNPDRIGAVMTASWSEVLALAEGGQLFKGVSDALDKGVIPDVFT